MKKVKLAVVGVRESNITDIIIMNIPMALCSRKLMDGDHKI